MSIGNEILSLAKTLWPIPRSLTGSGVRETLRIIKNILPNLEIKEVASGTSCLDWKVPKEWNVRDAYIIDPDGRKICDFKACNLHLLGYSTPIDRTLSLEDLNQHLYSLPEMPEAIPYITSYYKERWGFCLTETQRKSLRPGDYKVFIDSELKDGNLTYAELFIPGESTEEVFLSTYVCHPQMANNELSGPCVTTFLAKWIQSIPNRRYSYRVVFIPETIGSILYISRNLDSMKKNIVAGFNVSCIGDDRAYSYLPSRAENTISDRVAKHVLTHIDPNFRRYTFLDRGSDERQYCAPGVDLPIATVMRSKYGQYPEGGYEALRRCINVLEKNRTLQVTVLGEPQLGKRGLYPTLSTKQTQSIVENMMNLIAYCDGKHSLLDIAEKISVSFSELDEIATRLAGHDLLRAVK